MAIIPLPAALSGVVVERVVRLDSALLYLANGALSWLADYQEYAATGSLTEDAARAALLDMIDVYFEGRPQATMLGMIVNYATQTPPAGVLECNGATYQAADYPDLFAALDPVFKINATQFRVPDLRQRFVLGATNTSPSWAPGASGGSFLKTLTVANLPPHTHEISVRQSSTGLSTGRPTTATSGSLGTWNTQSTGDGQPFDVTPPYVALRFGILAR
jgi:microcystin-dependent protein